MPGHTVTAQSVWGLIPSERLVAVQARDPRRSHAYAAALRRTGKHAPNNAIHQNTITAWAYVEGVFAHVIGPDPAPERGHGGPPDEIVCITINASTTPSVTSTIQLSRHPHRRTPNTARPIPARRNGNPTLRIPTTPNPKASPVTTQNNVVPAFFITHSGYEISSWRAAPIVEQIRMVGRPVGFFQMRLPESLSSHERACRSSRDRRAALGRRPTALARHGEDGNGT